MTADTLPIDINPDPKRKRCKMPTQQHAIDPITVKTIPLPNLQLCKSCHTPILEVDSAKPPRPSNAAVCLRCGHVAIFDEHLNLVEMRKADWEAMSIGAFKTIKEIRAAIAERNRGSEMSRMVDELEDELRADDAARELELERAEYDAANESERFDVQ